MPPMPSQKGTGKKGAGAIGKRSRNTTPSSGPAMTGPTVASTSTSTSLPPVEIADTAFLELKYESLRPISLPDLIDPNSSNAVIPDSKSLDALVVRLQKLDNIIERRRRFCDRAMRIVAGHRKEAFDEMASGARNAERAARAINEDEMQKRSNKKKRKATDSLPQGDRTSPLLERGNSSKQRKSSRDHESSSSSLSPPTQATPGAMDIDEKSKGDVKAGESSSEDEGAPPRREVPQFQTFGEDPSTFPDPTIYEIREVKAGMSTEELKEIYSVAVYPHTDLADQIAGDPPDKDFTSAKPSAQINFSTFSTYVEPYFRPFNEEDLAFLRERGDRTGPFTLPRRGRRHYSEIWAEEDGGSCGMAIDNPFQLKAELPPNQARGSIENLDDKDAETDKLSTGPLLARLLLALRPEGRPEISEDRHMVNGTNGDVVEGKDEANGDTNGGTTGDENKLPAAAYMPESSTEAWKKATHPKMEYAQVDERIRRELRHIGFLPEEGPERDYDAHYDDDVAARLRLLQDRLRKQMLINGARKARLSDLVKERMAHQEYQTILEDLDAQVQGAYLKRTRTMGKTKKAKRPGGAGGGSHAAGNAAVGMARPGIGDVTKTLMERRRRWIDNIGHLFDDEALGKVPRSSNPDSSIFKPDVMVDYVKAERQAWDEEVEDE